MVNTATGRPPAPGYLTDVTDGHLILADQPEALSWFAKKLPFYRDYYRDEASPPAAFGLLLSAPDQLHKVRERWLAVAGHDVRYAGEGGRLLEAEFIGEEQVPTVGVLTLSGIRTSSHQVGSRG